MRARLLAGSVLLVGVAVAASGCEPPECQPTRTGEIRLHGGQAIDEVESMHFASAANQLSVGFGISPHPISMPLAGEMMAVTPEEDPVVPLVPDAGVAR